MTVNEHQTYVPDSYPLSSSCRVARTVLFRAATFSRRLAFALAFEGALAAADSGKPTHIRARRVGLPCTCYLRGPAQTANEDRAR